MGILNSLNNGLDIILLKSTIYCIDGGCIGGGTKV